MILETLNDTDAANWNWSIGANLTASGLLEFASSTSNSGSPIGNSPSLVITSTGAVGIGTTAPPSKLTVQTGTIYDGIALYNTTTNVIASFTGNSAANDNGTMQLYVGGSATSAVQLRASGFSYIANNGGLNIGSTSTPAAELDVNGGIDIKGANGISYPDGGSDSTSLAVGPTALAAATTINLVDVGVGLGALGDVTTGSANTAVGNNAGAGVVTGSGNTFVGQAVDYAGVAGNDNTGVGALALYHVAAAGNTAFGWNAGSTITSGTNNTAIGAGVGSTTLTIGSNNILIGTSNAVDATTSSTSNFVSIGGIYQGDFKREIGVARGRHAHNECHRRLCRNLRLGRRADGRADHA